MKSYMITMSRDSLRELNYQLIKEKVLPDIEKFEAIDSITNYPYFKKKALAENLCSPSYIEDETDKIHGKLGCNLSYLYLFKKIAESSNDSEWHLILEDDVGLDPLFPDFLKSVEEDLKEVETDYVLLYADPQHREAQFSSENHLHGNLYKMVPQYGTVGQLIKTSGIKKILSRLPMDDNIDFCRNKNIPLLSAVTAKNNLVSNLGSTCSQDEPGDSKMGSLIWDSCRDTLPVYKSARYIAFQMHIMWYESYMIKETLDSLEAAVRQSPLPVKIVLGLNSQTYIEKPTTGSAEDMFKEFSSHPLLLQENTLCEYITDDDPFYNIGDWRREKYYKDAIYTVWGESDCLIPVDYFGVLDSLATQIPYPHFVTLASRKMWDSSWDAVEHPTIRGLPRGKLRDDLDELYAGIPDHLVSEKNITQKQLDDFNNEYKPSAIRLNFHKVDGALLSISQGVPTPFIGPKVKFAREDTCFESFCRLREIPQFLVETRIKGHNYKHPLKRVNTADLRSGPIYQKYEKESIEEINTFLSITKQTVEAFKKINNPTIRVTENNAHSHYEQVRANHVYYQKCLEIIEDAQNKENLNSIIDIGGWAGGFVSRTRMKEKFCLDSSTPENVPEGVKFIQEDFLKWQPDREYDFTSCMQVLEHIEDEDVEAFTQKLFTLSPHVLISVPYQWPKGIQYNHLQDPVDEEKLFRWTKRKPLLSLVATEPRHGATSRRLISFYSNS